MNDNTSRLEAQLEAEHKPSLKLLSRLFVFVFSSAKKICLLFTGLSVLLSLLRPVLAFVWQQYADTANNYAPGQGIFALLALLLAYFLIDFVINLLQRYTDRYEEIERLDVVQRNHFQEMLDTRIYRKLAKLASEMFEIPVINDRIERVFSFTSDAWDGLNRQVMVAGYKIIAQCVSVITVAASLYIIEPALCWLALVAPLPTLYTTFISEKLKFKLVKDNAHERRESEYYEKLMLGGAAKEIKAFGIGDFLYDKWQARIDDYKRKESRTQFITALINMSANLISSGALIVSTILAIVFMTQGRISLGALAASMSLISTLIASTGALFEHIGSFTAKKNEAATFFDLMELPEEQTSGTAIGNIERLEIKHVKYRYPLTEKYVLDDVSLTINRGESIAFVGENGAGKTTFVRILAGMLTPSAGQVIINGIAEPQPDSRRTAISSVLQSPAKYNTFTVAENVYLGDVAKPLDAQRITEALAFSGLDAVDESALLGKDIGGTDLSGGQWQKLAIARAQYRNRGFILLDEPTGNLDPIAEADVFRKYLEIAQGRTLAVVTHRISVASLADRIVVFADGRIVEDGTHERLLSNNGEYARLFNTQAKWYDR